MMVAYWLLCVRYESMCYMHACSVFDLLQQGSVNFGLVVWVVVTVVVTAVAHPYAQGGLCGTGVGGKVGLCCHLGSVGLIWTSIDSVLCDVAILLRGGSH